MLFESVRQLLSTIRIKLSRSASRSEKLEPCGAKVPTRDASTSCGEPASVLGYLDAAVQVNEVMLIRTGREYGLFELGTEDEMSQKPGLPIIHQNRRRPEAIPEETIIFETPVKERRTTSSPPKSALRVTSQESSSADSFHSNKTGSDTGSSKSKQVSWEEESDQKTRSSDATEGSTSGAATSPQSRRRKSSSNQSSITQSNRSARVLDLLPVSAQTAFQTFCKLCASNGLLNRPADLGKEDSQEGLNDEVTLFRFFTARKCDIHGAYNQYQEAHETREASNVLRFFDCMDVDDYEETRKLVRILLYPSKRYTLS
ncbi:MAG: hypothetical protein Q9215_008170 [Flavoplaca cf. flavocitrina]